MAEPGRGVREAPARAMVAVRGDLADAALRSAVEAVSGTGFPEVGQALVSRSGGVLWMAPDELLLLAPAGSGAQVAAGLRERLAGRHVLVEDVSDMRAGFVVEGPVRDVLARVTPADVSPAGLQPGRVRRTRVGQVAAALWLTDESRAELVCFRSVASYALDLLGEAARSEPLGLYRVDPGG